MEQAARHRARQHTALAQLRHTRGCKRRCRGRQRHRRRPTAEAQFSERKGPSFSLLLTDLKAPNAHISLLERVGVFTNSNGTQAAQRRRTMHTLRAELEFSETWRL